MNTAFVECKACPLRKCERFRDFTPDELSFVSSFKSGELVVETGTTVFSEGTSAAHLYTVLNGWGFRYKMLDDGRRQILNYAMPGDLVGLQGSLVGEMQHSVEALTPMRLCMFERKRLMELFREHPSLGFDLTWIAAREEQILDEHLLSIGRRSALERAAYLLSFLYRRAKGVNLFAGSRQTLPITQSHVADTLGLSVVHTNKTLRKLAARGLVKWLDRGCQVIDDNGLVTTARWDGGVNPKRAFI